MKSHRRKRNAPFPFPALRAAVQPFDALVTETNYRVVCQPYLSGHLWNSERITSFTELGCQLAITGFTTFLELLWLEMRIGDDVLIDDPQEIVSLHRVDCHTDTE
jgi:hypothetical protein